MNEERYSMKIAVLGCGTVGGSLVRQLDQRDDIKVKRILEIPDKCIESRMTSDINVILDDPEIELIVDALPSIHPSYEYMKLAFQKGKHVVTSNKAALCYGFEDLIRLSDEKGLYLGYEATCGGTIPCIKEAYQLAKTNEINGCYGIMNGTTNYILYNMQNQGVEFDDALKKAQELGFAEKDPTADISGFDTKNKLVILSNTAYRTFVNSDFPVIGIKDVKMEGLNHLTEIGKTVKLLGISVRKDNRYALAAVPVILPMSVLEANVPDNYNMFTLNCSNAGTVKLFGQGAGGQPTADAMVRDILTIMARRGTEKKPYFVNKLTYDPSLLTGTAIFDHKEVKGNLIELSERAKEHNVFFAFEPDFLM